MDQIKHGRNVKHCYAVCGGVAATLPAFAILMKENTARLLKGRESDCSKVNFPVEGC